MIRTVFIKHKGEVLPAMIHDENCQKFMDMGYFKTHEEAEKSGKKKEPKEAE